MSAGSSVHNPLSLRSKLMLAMFGVLLALTIGEVGVRVLGIAPDQNLIDSENYRLSNDARLRYELAPGSRDGDWTINAAGQRDGERSAKKAPGVFRIAVVGDSIAYGWGVTQRDTLSAQLEQLLQYWQTPSGERFEVLNLGVSGYNLDQVVESIRARALSFQPDLIVYAYCLNDPESYSFEFEALKAALSRDDAVHQATRLLDRSRLWLSVRYTLRAHEAAALASQDRQWTALQNGSYADYFRRLYDQPEGAERLARGTSGLEQLSRDSGVPVLTVLFPLFVDLDAYRLGGLHRTVADLLAKHDLPALDLLPLYASMQQRHGAIFILNALHPNPLGHRLAALYLRHALSCKGLAIRPAQPPTAADEFAELDRLLEPVLGATERTEPAGVCSPLPPLTAARAQ